MHRCKQCKRKAAQLWYHKSSVSCVVLLQVGTLLGALAAKSILNEEQVDGLVTSAVVATVKASSVPSAMQQQLTADMEAAVVQQRAASRQQEVQAEQAKQKAAHQLADLHCPKVCFSP